MNSFHPNALFDLEHFEHRALFEGCDIAWQVLDRLEEYLKGYVFGKIEGNVSEQAYLIDREKIVIGKGSIVEPGAYIKGPCIIGRNCVVRHGAYVRGSVIAGDGCVIGHDTEMKSSIMLNEAHAAHFAYVGDSVLGNGVNLGAGTVLANLRLDRKEVAVKVDGKRIETGRRKFGAILGDGAQTGCNSVANPGTIFKKGTMCLPCQNVGGVIG